MLDQKISADILSSYGAAVLRICSFCYASGFLDAMKAVPDSHRGLWWDKQHLRLSRELKEVEDAE